MTVYLTTPMVTNMPSGSRDEDSNFMDGFFNGGGMPGGDFPGGGNMPSGRPGGF